MSQVDAATLAHRALSCQSLEDAPMLHYALVFLIIALIAGFLGFFGIAGIAATIAKVLFLLFLIVFVISLVGGWRRSPPF
jgi:uncharacterized membrane protein YtjA (UPF0391 family)